MVNRRNVIAFAVLAAALVVAYKQLPTPEVAHTNPRLESELRSQVHQQSEVIGPGLAYYRDGSTPAPTGTAPESEDINVLIQDFPTAAGEIHQQALAEQQYQAALEGDYDQAMKLMAESFLTGEGSGSYQERW